MLLRDRSGQSSQPLRQGTSDRSGQSNSRVHWDPSPPQVHTQRIRVQRSSPTFSNEFGLIVFRPLHLVFLFILSPFTRFVFLFSCMSLCLHVLSPHPFFRLRAHRSWP